MSAQALESWLKEQGPEAVLTLEVVRRFEVLMTKRPVSDECSHWLQRCHGFASTLSSRERLFPCPALLLRIPAVACVPDIAYVLGAVHP